MIHLSKSDVCPNTFNLQLYYSPELHALPGFLFSAVVWF